MAVKTTENCVAAMSVIDMARLCRMSRGHFHSLIRAGIMPPPIYSVRSRRPYYSSEQQAACLRVRETGLGFNGEIVLFYGRRAAPSVARQGGNGAAAAPRGPSPHAALMDGLRSLGMASVAAAEVAAALRAAFPNGTAGIEAGAVLRGVWQQLRRANGL